MSPLKLLKNLNKAKTKAPKPKKTSGVKKTLTTAGAGGAAGWIGNDVFQAAMKPPSPPEYKPDQPKQAFETLMVELEKTANKGDGTMTIFERLEKTASDAVVISAISEATGMAPAEVLALAESNPEEFAALCEEICGPKEVSSVQENPREGAASVSHNPAGIDQTASDQLMADLEKTANNSGLVDEVSEATGLSPEEVAAAMGDNPITRGMAVGGGVGTLAGGITGGILGSSRATDRAYTRFPNSRVKAGLYTIGGGLAGNLAGSLGGNLAGAGIGGLVAGARDGARQYKQVGKILEDTASEEEQTASEHLMADLEKTALAINPIKSARNFIGDLTGSTARKAQQELETLNTPEALQSWGLPEEIGGLGVSGYRQRLEELDNIVKSAPEAKQRAQRTLRNVGVAGGVGTAGVGTGIGVSQLGGDAEEQLASDKLMARLEKTAAQKENKNYVAEGMVGGTAVGSGFGFASGGGVSGAVRGALAGAGAGALGGLAAGALRKKKDSGQEDLSKEAAKKDDKHDPKFDERAAQAKAAKQKQLERFQEAAKATGKETVKPYPLVDKLSQNAKGNVVGAALLGQDAAGRVSDFAKKNKLGLALGAGGAAVTAAGAATAKALKKDDKEEKVASENEEFMNGIYKEAAAHIIDATFPKVKKYTDPMDRISF